MGRRLIYTALALAVTLALVGCGGDDGDDQAEPLPEGSGMGSLPDAEDLPVLEDPVQTVIDHLEEVGLTVCGDEDEESDFSGAYAGHSIRVAAGRCPSDEYEYDGLVSMNFYNDPNTAAEQLAVPFGEAYITWLIDPQTVASIAETTTPEVITAVKQVLSDYPSGGPGDEG
jgi:hypothetical protein